MVRNDMEHIHMGFKVMNKMFEEHLGYFCSSDTLTFFDMMAYNEIS